jgi:peptidoglycan/LPS O-acetylase OafA/YrhL
VVKPQLLKPILANNILNQIRVLNTLRGIAALIVVIAHYSRSTGLLGGYSRRGSGQLGVIFFMISGFLMTYIYLGKSFNQT